MGRRTCRCTPTFVIEGAPSVSMKKKREERKAEWARGWRAFYSRQQSQANLAITFHANPLCAGALVESHGQHVSRAVASREAAKSIVTLAVTGMSTEGTGQSIFATMSDTICGQPAASRQTYRHDQAALGSLCLVSRSVLFDFTVRAEIRRNWNDIELFGTLPSRLGSHIQWPCHSQLSPPALSVT